MKKLFFPVPVYLGIEILRGTKTLHDVCKRPDHNIVGYTDRAVAVLEHRRAGEDGQVCLIVVKLPENVFHELLQGDWVHFGATAHWKSPHVLEIEPAGYGRFSHEAYFSMEVINN